MLPTDQLLMDLADRTLHRYYGKYRGVVVDVDEPTLRIRAKVPSVLGDTDTGWCMPCVPYAGPQAGIAFLPEAGSGVWIEFEGGDVSYPIWTGCYWRATEFPPEAKATVKLIATAGGSKVILDDDAPSVTITDKNGNTILLDSTGITIKRGGKIVVSTSSVSVNDGGLEVV